MKDTGAGEAVGKVSIRHRMQHPVGLIVAPHSMGAASPPRRPPQYGRSLPVGPHVASPKPAPAMWAGFTQARPCDVGGLHPSPPLRCGRASPEPASAMWAGFTQARPCNVACRVPAMRWAAGAGWFVMSLGCGHVCVCVCTYMYAPALAAFIRNEVGGGSRVVCRVTWVRTCVCVCVHIYVCTSTCSFYSQ
jgi:hypothetical protein